MIDPIALKSLNTVAAPQSQTAVKGATGLTKDFGAFLNDALTKVADQQTATEVLNNQFAAGQTTDIHQLMIAAEKASLGLELTVQMRNKAVEAYQDIMRMQM